MKSIFESNLNLGLYLSTVLASYLYLLTFIPGTFSSCSCDRILCTVNHHGIEADRKLEEAKADGADQTKDDSASTDVSVAKEDSMTVSVTKDDSAARDLSIAKDDSAVKYDSPVKDDSVANDDSLAKDDSSTKNNSPAKDVPASLTNTSHPIRIDYDGSEEISLIPNNSSVNSERPAKGDEDNNAELNSVEQSNYDIVTSTALVSKDDHMTNEENEVNDMTNTEENTSSGSTIAEENGPDGKYSNITAEQIDEDSTQTTVQNACDGSTTTEQSCHESPTSIKGKECKSPKMELPGEIPEE